MNRSLLAVAVLALCACPPPVPVPDGGEDSGINPPEMDACSGGCAVNQRCDTTRRVCVDGCDGTCDGGSICQKANETFSCRPIETTCGTTMCESGQVACLGGSCSCLGPARGTFDSCYGDPRFPGAGQVCGSNGACVAPKNHQQCKIDGEPCPAGHLCDNLFGDNFAVCVKSCNTAAECSRGDICNGGTCYPQGIFNGQECAVQVVPDGGRADAGVVFLTTTAGSLCLRKDEMGSPTETVPSGTCTYTFFYFADQGPYPFTTCRPPGGALENAECQTDATGVQQMALQCSTGLECAAMREDTKGLCLRTCNALTPSVTYPRPMPECAMDEACVNLYRREDIGHDGALLGVCTNKCNVFDPVKSQCANYGSLTAVCVPTNPDGRVVVSNDGSGVCVPLRTNTSMLDMPCDTTDPFKGAACGAGLICPPAGASEASVCTQVCDTSCRPGTDGGVPTRCATEVHATCPSGKTCQSVTTTTGARVGFCQ